MFDFSKRRVAVFIDVQNMYYSARNIYGAKVNFGNIVKAAVGDQQLVRAMAYTISTKSGDEKPFFEALQNLGIDLRTKELLEYDSGHKKGDWDVGITIDVVRMLDMVDVVVMVSGDGDYCALAEYVKNRGRMFHVMSFRESTSSMLVEAADEYTNMSMDKKKFLIGGEARPRTPERRMSSHTDTFDDVIAEQVANKALHVAPTAPVAPRRVVPTIPRVPMTAPTVAATPTAPSTATRPIPPALPKLKFSSIGDKPSGSKQPQRGRGRPRKEMPMG